ncbi:MAG: hypothetical protein K2H86_06035 [Muribaculaceae bacterium]|nr:hypothetical protein [Muribaculaceae bacterium]
MQATIADSSIRRTTGPALRAYAGQVINRINSISEKSLLTIGSIGAVLTIIFAGCHSVAETTTTAVALTIAVATTLGALWMADKKV